MTHYSNTAVSRREAANFRAEELKGQNSEVVRLDGCSWEIISEPPVGLDGVTAENARWNSWAANTLPAFPVVSLAYSCTGRRSQLREKERERCECSQKEYFTQIKNGCVRKGCAMESSWTGMKYSRRWRKLQSKTGYKEQSIWEDYSRSASQVNPGLLWSS